MCAIATNALYTTLRKRGTTRQLAGAILTCVISALLLIPALVWYNVRFNAQQMLPPTAEVVMALVYIALCGWMLPLGATATYCLFTLPRNTTTAFHIPHLRLARNTTALLNPPVSQPGITPPFAYDDEAPWGWLEYKSGSFQGQRLALKRTIATMGRDESCDIWLDDEMASRHHAELAWSPGKIYLTDCGSLNGTLCNERRVRGTTLIKNNDLIEVGEQRFLFILAEHTTTVQDDDDPLSHHTWRSAQDLMTLSALQETVTLDHTPPRASIRNHGGMLKIRDGEQAGQSIALNRPALTIGRDPDCQITITDASISRQHAQILCQADGDYIQDLSSRNGTTVNGETLLAPRRLQPGDTIGVGSVSLEYTVMDSSIQNPHLPSTRPSQTQQSLISGPIPLRLPSKQKESQG